MKVDSIMKNTRANRCSSIVIKLKYSNENHFQKANLICHSFKHHLISPFRAYVIIVKNVVNHYDEQFSL